MTENERIRVIRKEKGLSMEKFGTRLGVSKVAISLIESGKSAVTNQMRRSICREFGVREEWLRTGEEPMAIPDDTFSLDSFARDRGASDLEVELIKAYFELDKDTREKVMARLVAELMRGKPAQSAVIPTMAIARIKPPQEMTDEELHAALDRQLAEEKNQAESPAAYGSGKSATGIA